jgi:hypothetical protein
MNRREQERGIDLGVASFARLANGPPLVMRSSDPQAEGALRRGQRQVARRQRRKRRQRRQTGGHRRRKAVALWAKARQRSACQRRDFPHKGAANLVQGYDVLYHDDLRVRTRTQYPHLAKSISEAGWSAFLAIRAFKVAGAGKRVVAVTRACARQQCSGPGGEASWRSRVAGDDGGDDACAQGQAYRLTLDWQAGAVRLCCRCPDVEAAWGCCCPRRARMHAACGEALLRSCACAAERGREAC